MTTENNKNKSKIKGLLTLAGSVLVVVALLVYFLPRESKFGYEYEQGRPWRYNSLIATFDFPIYKTKKEIDTECDSALSKFQPFYVEDLQAGHQQAEAFRKDFINGEFNDVPLNCLSHIEKLIEKVYDAGIAPSLELAQMAKERTSGIRIVVCASHC